jgi:hypothetical protein
MVIVESKAAPVVPTGLAPLARLAFAGVDMNPLWSQAIARLAANADDMAAVMDLATIAQLCGQRADGLGLQQRALERERLYRRPAAAIGTAPLRLLAFMAPGDFMANTPLEFLLEGSDVELDMLYLAHEAPFPSVLPEHDLAMVAIGQSAANRALLDRLGPVLDRWPRPVLNRPGRIAALSRDGTWSLLRSAPGCQVPITRAVGRDALALVASCAAAIDEILPGERFPIIARPLDSHAGAGLEKLDDAASVAAYLAAHLEEAFYVSPFVDYRGTDGLFRKYRIALIGGRPYACHMAASRHWMVHYLNAGMTESAVKREEEARFMAGFDEGFAARHAAALAAIAERVGLDYVAIDCGETPDGRLLVFEVDVAMIVHAMDPPALFPYKAPQMRKVFAAFRAMLGTRAGRKADLRRDRRQNKAA